MSSSRAAACRLRVVTASKPWTLVGARVLMTVASTSAVAATARIFFGVLLPT